jgi:mono/diheme cytochrome c family protein
MFLWPMASVTKGPRKVIPMRLFNIGRKAQRCPAWLAGCAVALGLAGCTVELLNTQPAREVAELAQPPGSVYAGWRVFQDRCVQCHGPAASGGPNGPDLLPRVREMGPGRFVDAVLARYDWNLPPDQTRPAQVQTVLQRKDAALTMPAWQDEPRVSAHIMDLYAYLSARAQGAQGPGRPQP